MTTVRRARISPPAHRPRTPAPWIETVTTSSSCAQSCSWARTEVTIWSLRTLRTLGLFSRMRPQCPSRAYSTYSGIPGLASNFASLTREILSEADEVPRPGSGVSLQSEKVLLGGQPAGIPGESARRGKHTVTGNDDAQGVSAKGCTDGARSLWALDVLSQCTVGSPVPVGDRGAQMPEDDALERGGQDQGSGQIEFLAPPAQVGVQLSPRLVQCAWQAQHSGRDQSCQALQPDVLGVGLRYEGRRDQSA